MKRKKPPVALISVLVFSVLGLVIASGAWKFYNLSPEDQMKQKQQEAMDEMKAKQVNQPNTSEVNAKAEAKSLGERMKMAADAKTQRGMDGEMQHKAIPTVVMPDMASRKPVKNTAAPTSQWYDNN